MHSAITKNPKVLTQSDVTCRVCPVTVEQTAKHRLARTGYPKLTAIECSFRDGTMTLRGWVSSYYHKQLAQEALRDVAHVRQLVNQLEVSLQQ